MRWEQGLLAFKSALTGIDVPAFVAVTAMLPERSITVTAPAAIGTLPYEGQLVLQLYPNISGGPSARWGSAPYDSDTACYSLPNAGEGKLRDRTSPAPSSSRRRRRCIGRPIGNNSCYFLGWPGS